MLELLRLATNPSVSARVREQARATLVLVLLAELLASAGGERRGRRRFSLPPSWSAPRRSRPPYAGSLAGRRPRG